MRGEVSLAMRYISHRSFWAVSMKVAMISSCVPPKKEGYFVNEKR
jgi:hypothetical protein